MTTHYRVDEERLETDGSSVTISNVGLDDEGLYKCILDFNKDLKSLYHFPFYSC